MEKLQFKYEQMDWDDLRVALAIARTGSLSGAARALKTSHPTIFRRLNAIEAGLGGKLFDRRSGRFALLPAGEEFVKAAEMVEGEVAALGRALAGQETQPAGSVRIATTDTLLFGPLPPMLASLRAGYPSITIEAAVANAMADLSRREADVAIRPALDPPPSLFGRRIATIAFSIYGAADAPPVGDADKALWAAPDDTLSNLKLSRWMAARGLIARAAFRSNSLVGLREAARAGLGIAPLPCYLGDPDPALRRLTGPIDELATELWILTHAELKTVGRIKVVMTEMSRLLAERRPLFEGFEAGAPAEPLSI